MERNRIILIIAGVIVLGLVVTFAAIYTYFTYPKEPIQKILLVNIDVSEEYIQNLQNKLEEKYTFETEIINSDLDITTMIDADRGQVHAKDVVNALEPSPETLVVAFTSYDTYSDTFIGSLNFVFSSVNRRNNIGIISTFRIGKEVVAVEHNGGFTIGNVQNPELLIERTMKTLNRMIGFSVGLKSTRDSVCVMAFSNSLTELDAKGDDFCEENKEQLKTLGMLLG